MNTEKQRLLRDLMSDGGADVRRADTLLAGGRVLRRRRHVRQVTQALAVLSIVALATLCIQQWTARQTRIVSEAPKSFSSAAASTEGHRLTDDELLALFPDVPVGLATLSDGRKRLIFPRPGDEARFIKYL